MMILAERMARRMVAEQTRARLMMGFDAAILAAHEVFQIGPGRAAAFANAYNNSMEKLATLYLDDCEEHKDKQIEDAKVDGTVTGINWAHGWYRVTYKPRFDREQHECFHFYP